MREISQRQGFVPEATWLLAHLGPGGTDYCGTIQGVREAADLASIQNIGVTAEHRGRGLGTLLIRHALAGLRDAGLVRVYLEVTAQNEGAVRLYERLGFAKVRVLYKTQDLVVA
jgi:ribosomal protein S18 acetylase RimI-like enzyme